MELVEGPTGQIFIVKRDGDSYEVLKVARLTFLDRFKHKYRAFNAIRQNMLSEEQ